MRKHEKDYLLRKDKKYQDKLHKTAAMLKANFTNAVKEGLKEEFATEVTTLIAQYKTNFDKLVAETDHLSIMIKKPVIAAMEFAETISSGVLDKQIDITSNDEMGSLCKSLNKMAKSLESNQHDLNDRISKQGHLIKEITFISGHMLK